MTELPNAVAVIDSADDDDYSSSFAFAEIPIEESVDEYSPAPIAAAAAAAADDPRQHPHPEPEDESTKSSESESSSSSSSKKKKKKTLLPPERCSSSLLRLRDSLALPDSLSILAPNDPRFTRHGNQRLTPFPPPPPTTTASSSSSPHGGLSSSSRSLLIESLSRTSILMDRAMGCIAGMAVGDAAGAPLEFRPANDSGMAASSFRMDTGEYVNEYNPFGLAEGQWTDDAAMGLCLADSILCLRARERRRRRRRRRGRTAEGEEGEEAAAGSAEEEEEGEPQNAAVDGIAPDDERPSAAPVEDDDAAEDGASAAGDIPPAATSTLRAHGSHDDDRLSSSSSASASSSAFDGSDARIRFWTWWHTGYNNAFRLDPELRSSVGLGGNISKSIYSMSRGAPVAPRYESRSDDAGNGSLMRLGPVPVAFHDDIELARDVAERSSYTTHPGPIAAEACRFLAHLIVRCIQRRGGDECAEVKMEEEEEDGGEKVQHGSSAKEEGDDPARKVDDKVDETEGDAVADGSSSSNNKKKKKWRNCLPGIERKTNKKGENDDDEKEEEVEEKESFAVVPAVASTFLDDVADEYLADVLPLRAQTPEVLLLRRLLSSNEPPESLERNWNWRYTAKEGGLDVAGTLRRRGSRYNGHPNSAAYFGSYSLDGLSTALHSVRSTSNFNDAVEMCVNYCGDADSTGSMAGQIAGAMYGWGTIHERLRTNLNRWDDGEVALRGALLAERLRCDDDGDGADDEVGNNRGGGPFD